MEPLERYQEQQPSQLQMDLVQRPAVIQPLEAQRKELPANLLEQEQPASEPELPANLLEQELPASEPELPAHVLAKELPAELRAELPAQGLSGQEPEPLQLAWQVPFLQGKEGSQHVDHSKNPESFQQTAVPLVVVVVVGLEPEDGVSLYLASS